MFCIYEIVLSLDPMFPIIFLFSYWAYQAYPELIHKWWGDHRVVVLDRED